MLKKNRILITASSRDADYTIQMAVDVTDDEQADNLKISNAIGRISAFAVKQAGLIRNGEEKTEEEEAGPETQPSEETAGG